MGAVLPIVEVRRPSDAKARILRTVENSSLNPAILTVVGSFELP